LPRARALKLNFQGKTGPLNAITDVAGLEVGYTTLLDEAKACCTGVTAIHPLGKDKALNPVQAGLFALNGNGEMTGSHWIKDAGYFASPICISNTHAVGMVHHATCTWLVKHFPLLRQEHRWLMPVIAETYDGVLNDINAFHITEAHVHAALDSASPDLPEEGNVGGGTGMICYQFKGGTGTASRVIEVQAECYTLGVLVQANHGRRESFSVLGVPVGQQLSQGQVLKEQEQGSIIVIIATDAPFLPIQLQRLAKRAALGIGRGGTYGGHSSGDIFLAFSTASGREMPKDPSALLHHRPSLNDDYIDPFYKATCDAVEEAVLNAMLMAEPMKSIKPKGWVNKLESEDLLKIMKQYGH
jgi:D-aminopeptidase